MTSISKSVFILSLASALLTSLAATSLDLDQNLSIDNSTTPPTYTLAWWGTSGYHYLTETSSDLVTWTGATNFNPRGSDDVLSFSFSLAGPRNFFRVIQFDPSDLTGFADSDADGLPDRWELYHFGNLARSGTLDFDSDGLTDLEEFQFGMDPKVNETASKAFSFSYDAIGRLTGLSGNATFVSFSLDAEGNITQAQ